MKKLNLGNRCHDSSQNLLSSCILCTDVGIKIAAFCQHGYSLTVKMEATCSAKSPVNFRRITQ